MRCDSSNASPELPSPDAVPLMSDLVKSIGASNRGKTIGLGVGIGIGVPALILAVYIFWRRLRRRGKNASNNNLTDNSAYAELNASSSASQSFHDPTSLDAVPHAHSPSHTRDTAESNKPAKQEARTGYAEMLRQLEVPASLVTASDSTSASPGSAISSKQGTAAAATSPSTAVTTSSHTQPRASLPPRERVVIQHEEDAGDAEQIRYEILPPMYREEWGQQGPQADGLTEPAVGVTPTGQGRPLRRAEEAPEPPISPQEMLEKEKILQL